MTNDQLNRKRLEKIKSWRETYGAGSNVMLPAEEAEELARMALAAMDSEPVAWTWQHLKQWHVTNDEERAKDLAWDGVKVEPLYRHAQPAPVVTFYRDGIEAAAKWIDQQREAYDSEHGRHDPDTGSFEFGNDAQREYSSTLEELAEGIRGLHPNAGNSPVIPDGYVMVPKEPTAEMIWAAKYCFTSTPGWDVFKSAYIAMLAAAPQPQNSPQNIPEIIPGWIPVSERMPENDVSVLTFDGMYRRVHHTMYGHWQCWNSEKITHWMPLPNPPKGVK